VKRVPIPQLDAETHIRNFVQIRVLKLAEQLIHALVEIVIRAANKVRFGAQTL
jgi:hypothetical protein